MLAQGTEVGVGGQSEGPWRWWGVQAHTWQQEMLGVICRSPLRRGGTGRETRGQGEGWVPRTAQGQRALRQAGRSLRSGEQEGVSAPGGGILVVLGGRYPLPGDCTKAEKPRKARRAW